MQLRIINEGKHIFYQHYHVGQGCHITNTSSHSLSTMPQLHTATLYTLHCQVVVVFNVNNICD